MDKETARDLIYFLEDLHREGKITIEVRNSSTLDIIKAMIEYYGITYYG